MTVDPVDDCTFWYTNEYYPTEASTFNWRTRIGNFKFPNCGGSPPPTATPTNTPTNTPIVPPTNTPTNTPIVPPTNTPTRTPTPLASDFSLSVAPASRTVGTPGNTTYTVTLTSINNFAGSVSLSVSGLPNRTTGTFSPNPVALSAGGSGTSTLTITTRNRTPVGTFTLTITGTSGGHTHTQTVTLITQ